MRYKHVIALAALAFVGVVAPAGAATGTDVTATKCVTVIQGGDIGEKYCVDDNECLVSEYRTTFLGTERYCTVRRPVETSASASTGIPVDTDTATTKCWGQSYGEFGYRYCVSTENSCMVSESRWGGMEGTYTCYVNRPV